MKVVLKFFLIVIVLGFLSVNFAHPGLKEKRASVNGVHFIVPVQSELHVFLTKSMSLLHLLRIFQKHTHRFAYSFAALCGISGLSAFYTTKLCWSLKNTKDDEKEEKNNIARAAGAVNAVVGVLFFCMAGRCLLSANKIQNLVGDILKKLDSNVVISS